MRRKDQLKLDVFGEPVEKLCSQCETWKPIGAFFQKSTGAGGVMGMCKDCFNARRVRNESPEARAEANERYAATHPDMRRKHSRLQAERRKEARRAARGGEPTTGTE